MKKATKYILKTLVIVFLLFGFYLYKLRTLSIEFNNHRRTRCLQVNPHLINYKNSFLSFADSLQNPDKYEEGELIGFFNGYIAEMRLYLSQEAEWLKKQEEFLKRWDFNLLEPRYIKEGLGYQWKIYETYLDEAILMLQLYDSGGSLDNTDNVQDARKRQFEYREKYFDVFDRAFEQKDWRKKFIYISSPIECTDEIETIPNTSGSIDWEDNSATPSPTLKPAFFELTS